MSVRSIAVVVMLVLAACGGSSPTPSPASSPTPAGATATLAATPAPGEAIDSADVRNAMAALNRLDSYQFNGAYFTGYSGVGTQVSLSGTERSEPTLAIDSTAHTGTGNTGQYIRIGNDIWVNSGDPDAYYHYDATDPANGALIAQYEPYALAAQIAQASGLQNTYQPVGVETEHNIESMHYGLSQADRDRLIQASGLDPQIWAGDVWLATNGGYLVALRWGPQMAGETQPNQGYIWDTTATNCECPVNPPTNVANP
jgi:hypothetical protein